MTTSQYHGDNRLILGIVLAVVTFWLFAQTTLNVAPAMRDDLRIAESVSTIAVSITALFSGILIGACGWVTNFISAVSVPAAGTNTHPERRLDNPRRRPCAREELRPGPTCHPFASGRIRSSPALQARPCAKGIASPF